jgi:hypothetical protein
MKSIKLFSLAALCVGAAVVIFSACQKSASASSSVPAGQQKFNMYLTDDPVNFQAVNIDIKAILVLVKTDSCSRAGFVGQDSTFPCYHWDSLHITPGVYNILNFQNGLDTMFSSTLLEAGHILRIRVVLGSDNSVVADSTTFSLDLLWGNTVDVAVNTNALQQLDASSFETWLDFDAGHSIIEVEHHHFALKPCIRLFTRANSGTLEGVLKPKDADGFVSVIAGADTLIALPSYRGQGPSGMWQIRGIFADTVSVTFHHTAGTYMDTTFNNVQVDPGKTTNLGTVTLQN